MNIHTSPGVFVFVRDLSSYVSQISTTITGQVCLAEKGPVNVPTLTTNMAQWLSVFGTAKDAYPYGALAAEQYHKWGSQLYTVRVVPQDAEIADYQLAVMYSQNAAPYSGIDPDNYLMKFVVDDKTFVVKLDYDRQITADSVISYPVIISRANEVISFKYLSVDYSGSASTPAYYIIKRGVYYSAAQLSSAINTAFKTGYVTAPTYLGTGENDLIDEDALVAVTEVSNKIRSSVSGGKIVIKSKYDYAFLANNQNGSTLGFSQKFVIHLVDSRFEVPPAEERRLMFTLPSVTGGYKNYIALDGGVTGKSYTIDELVDEMNYQLKQNVRKQNGNKSYGANGLIQVTYIDETENDQSLDPSTDDIYTLKVNASTNITIESAITDSTILNPSESSYLIWDTNILTDYNKLFTAQEVCNYINAAAPNGDLIAKVYEMPAGNGVMVMSPSTFTLEFINKHCYDVLGLPNDADEDWKAGLSYEATALNQHIYGNSVQFGAKEIYTIQDGIDTMIVRIGEDIDEERDGVANNMRAWDITKDASWSTDTDSENIDNFYGIYRIKFPSTAYGTYTATKMVKVLNDLITLDSTSESSNWEKLVITRTYDDADALVRGSTYPRWIKSENTKPGVTFMIHNGTIVAVCQAVNIRPSQTNPYFNCYDMRFGQSVKYVPATGANETEYLANTAWDVDCDDSLGGILGYTVSEPVSTAEVTNIEDNYTDRKVILLGLGGELANASTNENPVIDNVYAKNEGEWGNRIRLRIYYDTLTNCTLSVQEYDSTENEWNEVERFNNVVWQEELKDNEHILASDISSDYIDLDLSPAIPYSITTEFPVSGIYRLAGGSDGTVTGDMTQELIGSQAVDLETGWETGIYAFSDPEKIDINTLIVPFYSAVHWEVGFIADAICKTRGDAFFIWDCPQSLSATEVVAWHNGEYEGGPTTALNSNYSALYWPWVQVFDQYNDKKRWIPPSGFIAGQFAYSDMVSEPWFAVAGLNRGKLDTALDTEVVPGLGDRDSIYGNGNAVNPIVDFRRLGIHIWGQRTLQRKASALDRINVMRLVLFLRKTIATVSAYFVFEQNDKLTWDSWISTVQPFMEDVKRRRGLEGYKIVMDSSTVTDLARSQNRMPGKIFLVPIKSAEQIEITFVVNRSGQLGVDFEE